MRDAATRTWRGVSADERRIDRRKRLIAAGLEVIGTQGWARTTVREVCTEAALTPRYFYEAFPDREALLLAVFDHIAEQGTRIVIEAFSEDTPNRVRAKARAAIAAFFEWLTDDPRIGRVLLLEAVSDERLQQRRQQLMLSGSTVLADLATGHLNTQQLDRTDVELSALALVGAEAELATAYLAGRIDISRERLIDHITELHLALVNVSSVNRRTPTR
ncbi:AcrR family transcriptional regulator [Mycobacterium sp. MAA66]|uniref:TetR/AcrR family transcriptional regulator n=1 Tax=Mycobacterium sp. MAA66 TaxID=3156297 RepID=UPI0035191E68